MTVTNNNNCLGINYGLGHSKHVSFVLGAILNVIKKSEETNVVCVIKFYILQTIPT